MAQRGGPAGGYPGTTFSGGLNMQMPGVGAPPVRVIDENGNIVTGKDTSLYYPPRPGNAVNYPAAGGTPTNKQCSTLVDLLAPLVAQYCVQKSAVIKRVFRGSGAETIAQYNGAKPLAMGTTGIAFDTSLPVVGSSLITASEAAPVDVVLNNKPLIEALAQRLAAQLTARIDGDLLALYAQFTNAAAVGVAGTLLTDTVIGSAANALKGSGEPIFLFINPKDLAYVAGFSAVPTLTPAGPAFDEVAWAAGSSVPNNVTPTSTTAVSANTYPSVRLVPTALVSVTGSSPSTTHGLAITPSAAGLLSVELSDLPNNLANAPTNFAWGLFENFYAGIHVVNSGSGNQTIYAWACYGEGVMAIAKGQKVIS